MEINHLKIITNVTNQEVLISDIQQIIIIIGIQVRIAEVIEVILEIPAQEAINHSRKMSHLDAADVRISIKFVI